MDRPPVADMGEPADGRVLAAAACGRCHAPPSPAFLPAEEWPYILAWMGCYLGQEPDQELHPSIVDRNLLPPGPLVSREQFAAIREYFLAGAGAAYKAPRVPSRAPVSGMFEAVPLDLPAPVISLAAIDSADQTLLIGTSKPAELLLLKRGQTVAIQVSSEPVAFERRGEVRRVALMGHLGRDFREGRIVDFHWGEGRQETLVEKHPRITAFRTADVDGDGRDDLFVCGFGDYPSGRVGIWWAGDDGLQEQVLFEESGATWGDLADFDSDGDLDVVISIANARPRLLAFVNDGGRRLTPRVLIERHVGWGYNRCLLLDWDGDGRMDLVELAGNNLEARGRPLKSHYGVRVLRNEGNWQFREAHFEPLAGAMDVAAGDFDQNGRIDLAVTAFYPDWREEVPCTVLLLFQQPDGSVARAGIESRFWNRWMRVSAGDADGDGDTDVLLGAAEVPMAIPEEHAARYESMVNGKASLLLLRNRAVTTE